MAKQAAKQAPGRAPGRNAQAGRRTPGALDMQSPDMQSPDIRGDLSDASGLDGIDPGADRALIAATLRQIMRDGAAPAAARAQAARTLAEMVGALGRHAAPPASDTKPVAEMSREELEAELARSTLQHNPSATH